MHASYSFFMQTSHMSVRQGADLSLGEWAAAGERAASPCGLCISATHAHN